jgi:beta-fructofuranosidase
MTTRREFLAAITALTAANPLRALAAAGPDPLATRLAQDPQRPQFHLLPARNWMNDPNGPIYYKGHYHMFFQYNPHGATWGDMSWNHAVSRDMLHWEHRPLALTPTPDSPDSFGVFSGSAIAVGDRVYVVYTGTRESSRELATIRDGQDHIQESQCLAWSDDPTLTRWTKDAQPILPRPPAGLDITGFRDPSAWRQGDWYYMTVGSGIARIGGCVLLYRSRDLRQWEYLHPLISGSWAGVKTPNPCDDGEMWECPELFPLDHPRLGRRHALIYSTLNKVFWQTGRLDDATLRFEPEHTGELDLGCYYAPKTQLDAQGRRILWGWIREQRSDAAMLAAGWSGLMSLPRVLSLADDGRLRMQILPTTASLRQGPRAVGHRDQGQQATIPGACGELLCTSSSYAPLTLALTLDDDTPLLAVRYDPTTTALTLIDSTKGQPVERTIEAPAAPATDGTLRLHAFVDGSVIELMVNDRIGYTTRFYAAQPTAPAIRINAAGPAPSLAAWPIRPISPNRLTA